MNWYNDPQLDDYNYECPECGKPMVKDKTYCSSNCFDASIR